MISTSSTSRLSPRFAALLRESWCLLVLAAMVYLAVALATYQRADPGWSVSSTAADGVLNKAGAFGAYIADLLFYLFGFSAWWTVVALFAIVIFAFKRLSRVDERWERGLWLGLGGFVLVLIASSGIEALRFYRHDVALPLAPGGIFGIEVAKSFSRVLGFNGGTLMLLAFFAVGWSFFTGMSWLRLAERLGAFLEWVHGSLQRRRRERGDRKLGEATAHQREAFVEEEKRRLDDQPPVLVVPPLQAVAQSERVNREKQKPLFRELPDSLLPPLHLLEPGEAHSEMVSNEALEFTSRLIERKLADFGVAVKVVAAYPGPVITRYEVEPAVGVKGSQIVNLVKDLARALSVVSIRVVETIPGKTCMGLEIPNPKRQIVRLVEILSSTTYADTASPLTLALGKDIAGKPIVVDLAKMPHLLVAGTTGSGKSVAINAMILSLLYKAEPQQVRLLLMDPKMLELSVYEGIPHLLAPVVTDMKLAANALHWCIGEMERRYQLMSTLGVRNISGYNHRVAEAKKPNTTPETARQPMEEFPLIVVVIDELADLMMVVGKKVEELIARLAQKARAAGIHLLLATQRPSVDVITGLIKANVPARIAFQVASKVDSRTILDQMGAETLLGQGDMLYMPAGIGYPQRIHGAFVSDAEVHRVVEHLQQMGGPQYVEGVLESPSLEDGEPSLGETDAEADPLYDQAVAVVLRTRRPSISLVQRHLRIGYNRAARLIEQMEKAGLVSPMQSNGNREVLASGTQS